ncbi:MAG: hypothetical protein AABX38_07415 [Candidatus Micrarchaeota archaeon]
MISSFPVITYAVAISLFYPTHGIIIGTLIAYFGAFLTLLVVKFFLDRTKQELK